MAVITERVSAETASAVRSGRAVADTVVLDRSMVGGGSVEGAEIVGVDWHDDDAVDRWMHERGWTWALVLADGEELLVDDPTRIVEAAAAGPAAALATWRGDEVRLVGRGHHLGAVGTTPAPTVPGTIIRPVTRAAPDVTIVVATFNRPETLVDAVLSALGQRHERIEVVVVNDAGLDPRPTLGGLTAGAALRCVDAPVNGGLAATRNIGLGEARGSTVLFLDDDDRIGPDHVADLAAGLGDAPLVHGGALMVHLDADGTELARVRRDAPPFDRRRLLVRNEIVVHTALAHTEALRAVGGFDASLEVLEDWEAWLRLTATADAVTVPVWSAEYRLSGRPGANVITHSAVAQHEAMGRIHAAHPVTDPHLVDARNQVLEHHRLAAEQAVTPWTHVVGVFGAADPRRTVEVLDDLAADASHRSARLVVHQPAHSGAGAVLAPWARRAVVCIDAVGDIERVRRRLDAQALGAPLAVVDATEGARAVGPQTSTSAA